MSNKRIRKQIFNITYEDFDIDDQDDCDKSSLVSESNGAQFDDEIDYETDICIFENLKKSKKRKVVSSSQAANVINNQQLVWGNVNNNLQASDIPFITQKVKKMNKKKKSVIERVSECFQEFFSFHWKC